MPTEQLSRNQNGSVSVGASGLVANGYVDKGHVRCFATLLGSLMSRCRSPMSKGQATDYITVRAALNIKVLIAHSTPLIQAGLVAILAAQEDIDIVPMSPTKPDVALTDLDIFMASAADWACPVILVMPRAGERDLMVAARNGVRGYLTQACAEQELLDAVRALARGRSYFSGNAALSFAELLNPCGLTKRETDVLLLLAEGLSNKEIARNLELGIGTVKTHLKSIMNKLEANCRTQAVVVAVQRGLVLTEPR